MNPLAAAWAALTGSRLAQGAAAILVALIGAVWLRRDARQDARNEIRAEAAAEEQATRRRADAAAADAERDGAAERLRAGRF